jgi:hypothetical protein
MVLPLQVNLITMFSYLAYGLCINSVLPLPELVPSESGAEADVEIRFGKVCHPSVEVDITEGCFYATPTEAYLFWHSAGMFLVKNGHEIVIDPVPAFDECALRIYLLGSALGVLLHQRGLLVLHASALIAGDGAILFLGGSGWGKSTTAAALHAHGYGVIADDVVALDVDSTGYAMVRPAFPRLKLWPEVATSLGYIREELKEFDPEDKRREYRIRQGFPQTSLPLRCIYVLTEGVRQEVTPLLLQDAFVELIRHSYVAPIFVDTGPPRWHFQQCAKVASAVPIYRLTRERSLAALPEVVRLLQEHLHHV